MMSIKLPQSSETVTLKRKDLRIRRCRTPVNTVCSLERKCQHQGWSAGLQLIEGFEPVLKGTFVRMKVRGAA